MANPRGQQRDKPFRDALRMEIAQAQDENDFKSLRSIARALLREAANGDVQAVREIADRMDGKVTTTVGNDPDSPLKLEISWASGS